MTTVSHLGAQPGAAKPSDATASIGKWLARIVKAGLPRVERQASRVANALTPRNWRVEEKRSQCHEDIDREVGDLLRRIADPQASKASISGAVSSLLVGTMRPLVSRGEDRNELFQQSVKAALEKMPREHFLALLDKVAVPDQQADARHFVSLAYHDIRMQVRDELRKRMEPQSALDASGELAPTPELLKTLEGMDQYAKDLGNAMSARDAARATRAKIALPNALPQRRDIAALRAMQLQAKPRHEAQHAQSRQDAAARAAEDSVCDLMDAIRALKKPNIKLVEAAIESAMRACRAQAQATMPPDNRQNPRLLFRAHVRTYAGKLTGAQRSALLSVVGSIPRHAHARYFANVALQDIHSELAKPAAP